MGISTKFWEHVPTRKQPRFFHAGSGYAGALGAVNNGALESVGSRGPIPTGEYTIGPQQTVVTGNGTQLPGAMRLTPSAGNWPFGRSGFIMHGGNMETRTSSEGCIILRPPIRNLIGGSGDRRLLVVP